MQFPTFFHFGGTPGRAVSPHMLLQDAQARSTGGSRKLRSQSQWEGPLAAAAPRLPHCRLAEQHGGVTVGFLSLWGSASARAWWGTVCSGYTEFSPLGTIPM